MEWSIKFVYLVFALVGGGVLLLQTLLSFFGGGDHDVGHDAHLEVGNAGSGESPGHDSGLGLLSIRSVSAFLCFFGLVGMYGTTADWSPATTILAAVGAGGVMLLVVAWMLNLQRKVASRGNLDPQNALGKSAQVYLRIPARGAGKGKITVSIQGRTHEYNAQSASSEIATGADVRVVRLITPDTFEVEPLS